jgi:small subunit ribosomal protein S6
LTALYEAMFLVDNALVREDWRKAKAAVTEPLAKHGAKVITCRRWDEKKLAYPIENKNRATFYLTYFEMANEHHHELRRELELSERVLRYLILRVDELPPNEMELAALENTAEFSVPTPPPDDMVEPDEGPIGQAPEEGEEVMVPDLDSVGDDMPPPRKSEGKPSEEA